MFLPGPNYALNDTFLLERLRQVIADRGIEVVVETGLNDGQSTEVFSRIAPRVIGIDIDPKCTECARGRLDRAGATNYELIVGNSPDVLRALVTRIPCEKTMFFLDAHWDDPSPILDEIRAIPRGQGVLVFHDFKVPGHESDPDFGWDHMLIGGVYYEHDYAFLQQDLALWSPHHRVEYCTQTSGCKRGWGLAYPI